MSKRRRKKKRKEKDSLIQKVLKESTPLLLLTVLGGAFAGSVLGKMEEVILLVPGVIILVPAILDLRGDVGASFGSRLSSLLHLGILESEFKPSALLLNNIAGAFSLSFVFSGFFGMFAHILCLFLKLPSAGLWKLTLIGFLSGMLSSTVMIPFTLSLAIFSFRKGFDPDDIISPAIAVVGDGVAISSIWISTILVRKISLPDNSFLPVLFIVAGAAFPRRYRWYRIFIESSPVLVVCGILGIVAGLFLHREEMLFSSAPFLLVLFPQLVSKIGSIGSIAGMRLTSALYVGYSKPFRWNKYVWKNLVAGLFLALILVLPVAGITYVTAKILHIGKPVFLLLLNLTILVMVPLSFLLSTFSFVIASSAKKAGLDPSNFVVPLITSIGDISGILVFVILTRFLV